MAGRNVARVTGLTACLKLGLSILLINRSDARLGEIEPKIGLSLVLGHRLEPELVRMAR